MMCTNTMPEQGTMNRSMLDVSARARIAMGGIGSPSEECSLAERIESRVDEYQECGYPYSY